MTQTMQPLVRNDFDTIGVPLRPATRRRIRQLLSPTVEVMEFLEVSAHDPGLTFHLLRLANALQGEHSEPVFRVNEALFLLDGAQLQHLCEITPLRCAPDAIEALGAHSRLTAVVARRLAYVTQRCDPTRAYVAGLLHDLGKLVLIARDCTGSHSAIGSDIATGAALPDFIVDAIANHHRPDAATSAPLVEIVSLADQLAHGISSPHAKDRTAGPDLLRVANSLLHNSDPSTVLLALTRSNLWFTNAPLPDAATRQV